MYLSFSVTTVLGLAPTYDNMMKLLKKGSSLGFRYLDCNSKNDENTPLEQLAQSIADDLRLDNNLEQRNRSARQTIYGQENYFDISFLNSNGNIYLALTYSANCVYKKNDCIDFGYYISFILDWCQEFDPLWISTTYENYTDEFYLRGEHYCCIRQVFEREKKPNFKVETTILPENEITIVRTIQQSSILLDWNFFSNISDKETFERPIPEHQLSLDEILNYIIQLPHVPQKSLYCLVDNILYQLIFSLRFETYPLITLQPLNSPVALERTIRHTLEFCSSFCILELNTFDERYNYYQKPQL